MLAQAKNDTAGIPPKIQTIPKQKISKKMENFYNSLRSDDWKATLTKLRYVKILSNSCKPEKNQNGQVFFGNDGSRWEYLSEGKVGMARNAKVFRLIESPVPLQNNF